MSAGYVLSAVAVDLGPRRVLESLDLALESGCLTLLVGPNGAGKTTLLRVLAGLLPPRSGSVALDGRPLGTLAPAERARAVAYLPQGGNVAWPIPVGDIVALGRLPHGERPGALREEGREAVRSALAEVGLRGYERRRATDLSGGERARMLLARALATGAPVLLADEPVAALDPRHQLLVLERLRARARAGALVVAIMHDLALASRFADRLVLLDRGRVRGSGPPDAVLTAQNLAECFGIAAERVTCEDGTAIVPLRPLTIDE